MFCLKTRFHRLLPTPASSTSAIIQILPFHHVSVKNDWQHLPETWYFLNFSMLNLSHLLPDQISPSIHNRDILIPSGAERVWDEWA